MPGIFKYPPALLVLQRRAQQPFAPSHILLPRPLAYRLPRSRKLRAARHANAVRYALTWKQLLERSFIHRGRGFVFVCAAEIIVGLDLNRAAQHPGAAQVDVSLLA